MHRIDPTTLNQTRKEYLQRVRAILKTDINAKNTTDTIKTYAMPIPRKPANYLPSTASTTQNLTLTGSTFPESTVEEVSSGRWIVINKNVKL